MPKKASPSSISESKNGFSPKPARRAKLLHEQHVGETHTPTGQPGARRKHGHKTPKRQLQRAKR